MHRIMPLPFQPPRLDGLSERLLASHCENNCGGAVRRLYAIGRRLDELDWVAAPSLPGMRLARPLSYSTKSGANHEMGHS